MTNSNHNQPHHHQQTPQVSIAVGRFLTRLLACCWLITSVTPSLSAQDPERTVLSASGASTLSLTPETVRLAIPLYAHTLSSEESLELIRERKETAKQRVSSLSCIADSITFGSITVEVADTSNQMSASSLRILGGMGNNVALEDLPVLVTARVDMTADWALPPGADQEAVLGIVERIVTDLKTQDITGKEARPEFSPQVEETLKQLQIQARSYMSSMNRSNMDEIRYAFVARPTTEQQHTAMRTAVEDAREQVTALAAAMDLTVGNPLMLNSNSSLRNSLSSVTHSYNGRTRVDVLQPQANEVLSELYTGLSLTARVQIQYNVKQKEESQP